MSIEKTDILHRKALNTPANDTLMMLRKISAAADTSKIRSLLSSAEYVNNALRDINRREVACTIKTRDRV